MKYLIRIPCNGMLYCYNLLPSGGYQKIVRDGVVVFDIVKRHNHRYELSAFFYARQYIVWPRIYSTKKELYDAIQMLLQEFL